MPFRETRAAARAKGSRMRRQSAERWKESIPDKFHTFAEDSPDSMMIIEGSGRLIAMNASARNMLGYSRQDLPDLDLDSIGAHSIRNRLNDFRRQGRVRVEASAHNKDGLVLRMVFHTAAMGDGSYQIVLSKIEDRGAPPDPLFEEAPLPLVELSLSPGCILVESMNRQARLLCGGGEAGNFIGREFSTLFGLRDEELQGLLAGVGGQGSAGTWIRGREEAPRRYYKIFVSPRGQAGERVILGLSDMTEEKNAEVELSASLKGKILLIKESNHRVKNGLGLLSSMLSLQREALEDEACSSLLLAAQLRIQAMAQFHDRLSTIRGEGLDLDLGPYIADIAKAVENAYLKEGSHIRIRTSIQPIELDAKRSSTVGLIVNELLTNCLKYAFPGEIGGTVWIGAELTGGLLRLCVSDDGVGLSPGFDWRASTGLGFQFIDALTQQLSAIVHVESEGGLNFSMSFQV